MTNWTLSSSIRSNIQISRARLWSEGTFRLFFTFCVAAGQPVYSLALARSVPCPFTLIQALTNTVLCLSLVRSLPTLFFVKDGKLQYRMEGALGADELQKLVDYVLFEGPPPVVSEDDVA